MRRLIKILWVAVALLIAVVVAGVAVIKSLDFNEYKGLLAEQVKAATGRDLVIAGDLDITISLTPSISVEGVTLANAPWGSRPEMIKLKRLVAEAKLIPLLSGELHVERLILSGFDALLETDAQGRANWDMGGPGAGAGAAKPKPAPDADSGSGGILPVVRAVLIEDVRLAYRDGATGETQEVHLDELQANAKGLDAPMQLLFRGRVNAAPFEAGGTLGSVRQLTGGEPYPVKMEAKAFGAQLGVQGKIADVKARTGLDLGVELRGGSVKQTLDLLIKQVPAAGKALAGIELPGIGPFKALVKVTGDAAKPEISGIDIAVGDGKRVLVTAKGQVGDIETLSGLDMAVGLQGAEIRDLLVLATPHVPGLAGMMAKLGPSALGPVKVAAQATGSLAALALKSFDVDLGRPELARITAKGTLADAIAVTGLDASVGVEGAEINALLALAKGFQPGLAGLKLPALGPLKLAAQASGSLQSLAVKSFDLALGRDDLVRITANGALADAMAVSGLDATFGVKGPEIRDIVALGGGMVADLAGLKLPALGPLNLTARARGSLKALALDNIALEAGTTALARVTVNGAVADAIALNKLDLTVGLAGKEVNSVIDAARPWVPDLKGMAVPAIGPFKVSVAAKGSPQNPSLPAVSLDVGRDNQVRVRAKGSVLDPIRGTGADIGFDIVAADISAFSGLAGSPLPAIPKSRVQGRLTNPKGGFVISGLKAALGDSDLAGRVAAYLGGARPRIDADLKSTLLDIDKLLPPKKVEPAGEAPAKKPSGQDTPAAIGDDRVFPPDPLPLGGLKAGDAKVKLALGRVIVEGISVENLAVDLQLENGDLDVKTLMAKMADGTIAGDLSLHTRVTPPRLRTNLTVKELDYGKLLVLLEQPGIAKGKVDIKAKLTSRGNSVRALMAGLAGTLRVTTAGGSIEAGILKHTKTDLLPTLLFGGGDAHLAANDIRCGVVDVTITDGTAISNTVLFETGAMAIVANGRVNLGNEKMNIVVHPRAKNISIAKLAALPWKVGGTLASPTAAPDPKAIVKGVAEAAEGGLRAITGFFSGETVEGAIDQTDYCRLALAGKPLVREIRKKPAPPKPPAKPAAGDTQKTKPGESIGDTLKNLGEGLSDSLGKGLKGLFGN